MPRRPRSRSPAGPDASPPGVKAKRLRAAGGADGPRSPLPSVPPSPSRDTRLAALEAEITAAEVVARVSAFVTARADAALAEPAAVAALEARLEDGRRRVRAEVAAIVAAEEKEAEEKETAARRAADEAAAVASTAPTPPPPVEADAAAARLAALQARADAAAAARRARAAAAADGGALLSGGRARLKFSLGGASKKPG